MHRHPLDAAAVTAASDATFSIDRADEVCSRLAVLTDPTRLRILQGLTVVDELCVGDVALGVQVSQDAASYALRVLRAAGFVRSRREGRAVFYRLADGFPLHLMEDCVGALAALTPSDDEEA